MRSKDSRRRDVTGHFKTSQSGSNENVAVLLQRLSGCVPGYGLATVRNPVLEIEAKVEPFENSRGFSLRILRAGRPRFRSGI
jgi:hypothetical protein